MKNKKKVNYWLIGGALVVLLAAGYYSYLRDKEIRNNGVYTIAQICPKHIARGGWKVYATINFRNKIYEYDPVIEWEHFGLKDTCKVFFVKILDYDPEDGIGIIPKRIAKPDSIKSAPPEGWSEAWMKEHFPKVVEYVHDTR